MKSYKIVGIIILTLTMGLLAGSVTASTCFCCLPCEQANEDSTKSIKLQTTCPVMGGNINKAQYVDVKGFRIYVCCEGCLARVKVDPDKYIESIKAKGETPELAPVILCKKCGYVKSSDLCCKEGQLKCSSCGFVKGSPGCCKIPHDSEGEIILCTICGEIKGSEVCCKTEGR